MIDALIRGLVDYAIKEDLIYEEDRVYCTNAVMGLIKLDAITDADPSKLPLNELLDGICDYAAEKGLIENNITNRDLLDTAIMGIFTPRPSEVIREFRHLYFESPKRATDYFYKLCGDVNYIRRDRIEKIIKWQQTGEYGTIDITINLSKPEKDPKEIAAAKNAPQAGYPKCMLCRENEGYAGRIDFPARQNHRMIPIQINNENWFMQYSPYVYYNEHCIVFAGEHKPMKISKKTFSDLLDFVTQFPHYFIGSNADLPIVGGSILAHEHFQGGRYEFAMERASIENEIRFRAFPDVKAGIVCWPMSTLRLQSLSKDSLVELADKLLAAWRTYSDESVSVYAETNGEPHNTVTPIARKRGMFYELDLVFRNNKTSAQHPLGMFHPHAELHHIKKENIGLIEVMGLAVLPPRLKTELEAVKKTMLEGGDLRADKLTAPHADWVDEFKDNYTVINDGNIDKIINDEVGKVFAKVLEHAGVFKRNPKGREAFIRFLQTVG